MNSNKVLNIHIPYYNMKCITCKTMCPLTHKTMCPLTHKTMCPLTHKIASNVNYYTCFTPLTFIIDCIYLPYTFYKEVVIRPQIVEPYL